LEGDLISAGIGGSGLTVTPGVAPGTVTLNFRQGASGGESGVIARLAFKAKAVGTSPITIQSASIKGKNGVPISVKVQQGVVNVR
jgi:hypothetical protein